MFLIWCQNVKFQKKTLTVLKALYTHMTLKANTERLSNIAVDVFDMITIRCVVDVDDGNAVWWL